MLAEGSPSRPDTERSPQPPPRSARLPVDVYEVTAVEGYPVDDTLGVVGKLRPDGRIVMQTRPGKGARSPVECWATRRLRPRRSLERQQCAAASLSWVGRDGPSAVHRPAAADRGDVLDKPVIV